MRRRRRRPSTGAGDTPRKRKRPESTRNSPRIHSCGRFEWRTTGEADRWWSKASSNSNGVRQWWGRISAVRSRSRGLGRWRRCRGRFPREESRYGGRRREIDKRGAGGARELELRSALDEVRRKREMTSGSHDYPDKYLGDAWRTVRRPLADCPRGGVTVCSPNRTLSL